ncbi:MAG: tail fiber domain-containing protein [Oceanipulchritudo sp.]
MNAFRSILLLASLGLVAAPAALAAGNPPELLSYQSYLVDANGVPLGSDGAGGSQPANYDVVFRLYDAPTQGNLLWSEQQTITVDNGYFSVLLGEGAAFGSEPNPALSTVFTGIGADERFVSVAVRFEAGGEFTEILPRLRLLTSPYSFLASQARSLVNPDGEAIITADGGDVTVAGTLTTTQPLSVPSVSGSGADLTSLNASNLGSGTVPLARLPGLPASQITSGTISQNRLTSLNADSLVSGTVPAARIPGLPASQITSGTLSSSRLPASIAYTSGNEVFDFDLSVGGALRIGASNHFISRRAIDIPPFGTARVMSFNVSNVGPGGFNWVVDNDQRMSLGATGNLSIDGTLSQGSDRERKEGIEEVNAKAALEKLLVLPIYEWSYIGDPFEERHIGPMAQDFHTAFGLGKDEKSLSPADVSGLTVVAIQELNRKVEAQEAEIEALRKTVSELQTAVEALVELRDASQ